MKKTYLLPAAVAFALAGCSGNSFKESVDPVDPVDPTDPTEVVTETTPVTVPEALRGNVSQVIYEPGSDELQIAITGLDTTPVLATWSRRDSLQVPGFEAYAVQEDALDRLFVALAGQSADGSARAVLAGDGGQFNYFFVGTTFERIGDYTPPAAIDNGPATGQVSYVGRYAGTLNVSGDPSELLTPPAGVDGQLLPGAPSRVTGQGFMNANFADNTTSGIIYNRTVQDFGIPLASQVLNPSTIQANGTVNGTVERSGDSDHEQTGTFGLVFGGTDASSVAGALDLETVAGADGETIEGLLETGVFILDQCGLTTNAAACNGTAP